MTPEQIVLRFIESIGDRAEARAYLELFRSGEPERFALIDVGRSVRGPEAQTLSADLSYLIALGLSPVLFRKAGPPLLGDLAIAEATSAEQVRELAHQHRLAYVTSDSIDTWATRLATRKVILLDGALRAASGELIPMVDCTTELDSLELARGHDVRLARAAAIIAKVPHKITVALTYAVDLLRELFTVRGAGTLVRRGAEIERSATIEDRAAMAGLLGEAFGKEVKTSLFERAFAAIYIAGDHDGAALVEPDRPAPYLSKFAVGMEARGEGIGRDLWRRLVADHPRMFWRARPTNPITGWYIGKADGFHRARGPGGRDNDWNVFWIGLAPADIPAAIARALDRRADFEL